MHDVNCPYCGEEIDIDHEDGYGYQQDTTHQQECEHCGKTFTYTTAVTFSYEVEKADCLNGEAAHFYRMSHTFPRDCAVLRCDVCHEEIRPSQRVLKHHVKRNFSGRTIGEIIGIIGTADEDDEDGGLSDEEITQRTRDFFNTRHDVLAKIQRMK